MTAERSSRLRELFDQALEHPAQSRASFLTEACSDDDALRAEVSSLLDAFEEADSFLETSYRRDADATHKLGGRAVPPSAEDDPGAALIGKTIGRYRIERLIAAGGMGVVYAAQQDQPRRTAAVKVIRAGIASRAALHRFEHEAEILGRLRHPGIAQVYEAGIHDDIGGRVPYFAMEYIPEPRTIVQYAEAQQLTPRARLELFARVCDAVHHAHQHGVIHRDLKPGNILVDPAGRPKVVDFGVARATDADLQTVTLQTSVGELVGTVPYMSPEQVKGDPLELDTRSDVYSLGLVCYELLTGRLPYDVKGKPLLETARVIREQDAQALGAVSHVFRGDVETIVAKALEKDRERRYQSAAGLAADIRRYLNNEPIAAHPPSAVYQLHKFAQRNKALVGGVAAVFVVLVAGIIGVSISLARTVAAESLAEQRRGVAVEAERLAEQRRGEAVEARDESEAVTDFLVGMLASVNPFQLGKDRLVGKDVLVRDMLDEAAATIGAELAGQPRIEARLRQVIGSSQAALSEYTAAEVQLQAALELRRRALGPEDPDTLVSMGDLATLYHQWDRFDESERLLKQAMKIQLRVLGEDDPAALTTMHKLASVYYSQRRFVEAESLHRQTLELRRRVLGADDPATLLSMSSLAAVYQGQRRYDEAEELYKQTLEQRHRALGPEHPQTLLSMSNLLVLYELQGRFDDAKRLGMETLAIKRRVMGPRHLSTANTMNLLARVYYDQQRYEEAEPFFLQALEIHRQHLPEEHPNTLGTLNNLAALYYAQRKYDRAEPLYRQALELNRGVLGEEHQTTRTCLNNLTALYLKQRHYDEAAPLMALTLGIQRRVLGEQDPLTLKSMSDLAGVYFMLDQYDQSRSLYSRALEIQRRQLGEDGEDTLTTAHKLASVYKHQKRYDEAERLYAQTLEARRRILGAEHSDTLLTMRHLADLYNTQGRHDKAEPLFARAVAGARNALPTGDFRTGLLLLAHGECLSAMQRYEDAEDALLEAQEILAAVRHPQTTAIVESLTELYDAWDRPDQADRWRAKLPL